MSRKRGEPVDVGAPAAVPDLDAVLRSIKDVGILALDARGTIVACSAGTERIRGAPAGSIVGQPYAIVFTDEDRATGHPEEVLRIARETGSFREERWRRRADGSPFLAEVVVTPTLEEDGTVAGYVATARDLSDRRDAESARAAAAAADRRVAHVLETIPDGVFVFDADGRITFVNDNGLALGGRRREDVLGKRVLDFVPEVEDTALYGAFVATAERRVAQEVEELVPGTGVWLRATFVPTADGGVFGYFRDVTAARAARKLEEEVRAADRRLIQVLETMADAAFTIDAEDRFTFVNAALTEVAGVPAGAVLGRRYQDVFPESLATPFDPAIQRAKRERRATDAFGFYESLGRWFDTHFFPTDDGGVFGYVRDVTERQAMTLELERTAEERRELLAALVSAQEDERARIAQELHDGLGQVLASLALFAAGLEREVPEPEREKVARFRARVEHATAQMRELVSSFRPIELDYSGLGGALEALVDELREHGDLDADLAVEVGEERLPSELEATIFRVVQEATTNALRYADAASISVVVTRTDGTVTAVVEDDGRGFDVDAVRPGSHGLLGIRERAALLGGSATITSAPGRGTVVRIEVPMP